jgi:hypothetical protein
MCPALDTEPTPCVASGLGAGNLPQAASCEFISLPIDVAHYAALHGGHSIPPGPRSVAPTNLANSTREQSEAAATA